MKLSDYVIKFIENIADSIFLLSGGHVMHLVDSVGKSELDVYCCHHEQAAVTSAEGYARIRNNIGVALITTPGIPNAVTGLVSAWLDSIPVLIVGGQVKRDDLTPRENGIPTLRQLGFQEVNTIDIIKPITKYAVTVNKENEIRYHLEKAVYLAKTGRPGPVWVEIPLDVQAEEININKLKKFTPPADNFKKTEIPIQKVTQELEKAKRPLMLVGNGIRLGGGEEILWKLVKKLNINVVSAIFTADDLITKEYPYYLGRQGMPGNVTANYAVDNCDLLLIVGERMQLTQTSFDYKNFAKKAKKIMVDIDNAELNKKTLNIDIPICCDAKYFLAELYKQKIKLNRWNIPVKPINPDDYKVDKKYLNVYRFFAELNKYPHNLHTATANAMASLASHQALEIKRGQRFITNAGLGHMGSGLPLAMGACIAAGKKPVVCLEGDGSIMLNIQELQTIVHHKLPIKIFIFNNNGYFSIRNTHLNYFKKIFASDSSCGVTLPDYKKIAKAWNISYVRIAGDKELYKLKKVMHYKKTIICELILNPMQPMLSKWTAGLYSGK